MYPKGYSSLGGKLARYGKNINLEDDLSARVPRVNYRG
jgi:hypothetical protein